MSNIKDPPISSSQMSTSDEVHALRRIALNFEQALNLGNFNPDFIKAVELAIHVCRYTTKFKVSLTLIDLVITILSSHLKQRPDGLPMTSAYAQGLTQAINRISALESGFVSYGNERKASH